MGAYKALRIHEGGCLTTRMVDCKGATLHADKEVLLLRVLEDGREDIPQGVRHNQSVLHATDQRRKDYTTDTTGLLRHGKEGMAVV